MSALFGNPASAWAALAVVVLPIVIIGAGELEERLRQADSPLGPPIGLLRSWVVPLFVTWVVVRALFGLPDTNPVVVVLASALVVALAALVLRVLAIVVVRMGEGAVRSGRRPIPRLLLALPRVVVLLVAGWLLLAGVWNIDLSAALTALGVTSLVVSLALQEPLSSLASGFLLLSDQPFQPGDWIRVNDLELEGRVVDVNWRTTRIETRDGDLLIMPNGVLAEAVVQNMDQPTPFHRLEFPIQIAFANPPTRAKEMLLAAARATPGVLADPAPGVMVVQVDDPLMGYVVHLWIDDVARAPAISSEFGSLVWYFSHRHDVPLPSPAQDLYLYDGVATVSSEHIDRPELLRRLRGSPLLVDLDDEAIDALADAATSRRYARGETILRVGSPDTDLHLLHAGPAAVVLEPGVVDETVLHVAPGEVFGLLDHPVDGAPETAILAMDDCQVVTVSADAAMEVISRHPQLSAAVEQLATGRRRRLRHALRRRDAGSVSEPGPDPAGAAGGDHDHDPSGGRRRSVVLEAPGGTTEAP